MKHLFFTLATAACLFRLTPSLLGAQSNPTFIYETSREFFGRGDFDGDGRLDIVIVDKETGKYRLGYQLVTGTLTWVDNRPSGMKGITGFSIGKLLTNNLDALAFTAPDANQITMVDVSSPTSSSRPVTIPFTAALGPNMVLAAEAGGNRNNNLHDLYVGSIYNSPDQNQVTLLRNDGSGFPRLAEAILPAPASRGNRVTLKAGQPEVACLLLNDANNAIFRSENLTSDKIVSVITVSNLPAGSDYAVGNFRHGPLSEFLFYKPGSPNLTVRSVEESTPGKFDLSKANDFDLGQPIRRVITLDEAAGQKLCIIFGDGEQAGVFEFDGVKTPVLKQTIVATNEQLMCAISIHGGLLAFSHPAGTNFSTRYYAYKTGGPAFEFTAFGGLPSLADNDNVTIPEIHSRIVANLAVTNESDMKPYTNTIPGTRVTYAMVPIPAGEFVMGSPDSEPNRKPDEGPLHKVKISPFWMGKCEVTWNEYELFMYPDEEQRMRAAEPTDEAGDKLADAVTHPSKPYVEMSFGMGKEGFPAISMTQHGANKYCQWLSSKTGQFYRLPTEAEWEYACRAGTTNTYFFGDDAAKLGEYAWFEQNSDFKYQKVGKKKPNPWGLYDIYGNVVEWVLDQYDPDFYKKCATEGTLTDPWNKANKPYPHSVRGGSWDDEATMCRSAARRGSDRSWKMQDPQLPKSIWYHSDAQWVGFRVVRPLKVPSPQQMQKYWSSGVERD
jgi:formylglycine-generating enzyme required for sulfatase activity